MCAQCGCEVPKDKQDRKDREASGAFSFESPTPAGDETSPNQAA